MTGLDRLLAALAEVHPLDRGALPVAALMNTVVPYRRYRRQLGISSIEEYELLVLRLCAGEGGYGRLDPGELVVGCREALDNPAPGIDMVPGLLEAQLFILRYPDLLEGTETALADTGPELDSDSPPASPTPSDLPLPLSNDAGGLEEKEAAPLLELPDPEDDPPEHSHPPDPAPGPAVSPSFEALQRPEPGKCPGCSIPLPSVEWLRFCPGCGTEIGPVRCPGCRDEVAPGWRHCPRCGHQLGAGGEFV